ncbi:S-layer protein [Pleurocapsa sp. CCALA 161]|uniref:iron uptake porin n=1 Tax=Pleurocapsa sp. CCALA 161 TaxID=2107688 RepID=UPI000D07EE97|nr:iron uptake porin [Pleurocapsa sp. CCALA 161]PSB10428.1 S-layer protein [Pleurocapsa sp. CCALA 161]
MIRLFWQAAKVAPVLFAACLFSANSASAQSVPADKEAVNQTLEQINNYQQLNQNNQSQVTNVNQLRDVSPTDWAYEALRSLVDRYGCIAGFPNQTYRGDQALTRYEFAAGLNSCLNQIERLIASNSSSVDQEQLDTINRLQQEFEAELATLGGRVDEIESRTAVLEDSQFSTTTKLKGEAIFSVSDAFGDVADNDGVEDNSDENDLQTTLSNRVRLNFDTSFTGKDRLRARLQAGNITEYDNDATGTNSTRLGYENNNDNNIEIADLHYRFPVGEKANVWVGTEGLDLDDVFNVNNPQLEDSGTGALTRFNRYNPLLFRGVEGAGAGVNLDIIEDKVGVNVAYLTDNASDSSQGEGLFNGSYNAGAQLEFAPFEALQLTATYVRDYQSGSTVDDDGDVVGAVNYGGGTVSGAVVQPFGAGVASKADKFGLGASFNVGEKIALGAFGGYANADSLGAGDDQSGDIWTWGANASLLDLVKEGSVLSIAGGMLPRFTSDDVAEDEDTSYLVEALYKFPLSDNISITPGAYAVFNANHDTTNDTVYVGVVRTTFEF